MEYRIIKRQYIDRFGSPDSPYYLIQYQKKFLWWTYWTYLTHKIYDTTGSRAVNTIFKLHADAKRFAERHLCGGELFDGVKETIVETNKCT